MEYLIHYDWPGNVHELQNVSMRFAMGLGIEINSERSIPTDGTDQVRNLAEHMAATEKQIIRQALMAK